MSESDSAQRSLWSSARHRNVRVAPKLVERLRRCGPRVSGGGVARARVPDHPVRAHMDGMLVGVRITPTSPGRPAPRSRARPPNRPPAPSSCVVRRRASVPTAGRLRARRPRQAVPRQTTPPIIGCTFSHANLAGGTVGRAHQLGRLCVAALAGQGGGDHGEVSDRVVNVARLLQGGDRARERRARRPASATASAPCVSSAGSPGACTPTRSPTG